MAEPATCEPMVELSVIVCVCEPMVKPSRLASLTNNASRFHCSPDDRMESCNCQRCLCCRILRVDQNRMYTPYMSIYMVVSLLVWFWPTLICLPFLQCVWIPKLKLNINNASYFHCCPICQDGLDLMGNFAKAHTAEELQQVMKEQVICCGSSEGNCL
jgi:hypothetical protein